MKPRRLVSLTVTFLAMAVIFGGNTRADLLYSNGPVDGTTDANTISSIFMVPNSFVVSAPATATGAENVGFWVLSGDTPLGVDWSIGTTPFASDVSFGTSPLSNTFLQTNTYGFDVYSSSFSIDGTLTGGDTYYLTLANATVTNGDFGYWDVNNGPSSAFSNALGPINSESFSIVGDLGTAVDVPEIDPRTSVTALALMGMAAVMARGKRRKPAIA